jgi:hypothetical protein
MIEGYIIADQFTLQPEYSEMRFKSFLRMQRKLDPRDINRKIRGVIFTFEKRFKSSNAQQIVNLKAIRVLCQFLIWVGYIWKPQL